MISYHIMSVNPQLSVRIDTDTIKEIVLKNVIKMLHHRGWVKKENIESRLADIIGEDNEQLLYKIKLDVKLGSFPTYEFQNTSETDSFADDVVFVKILPQKVTSIAKSPIIVDFLTTYKTSHKILVVDEISDKSKNALMSGKYVEVFSEKFLLQNVLEHDMSPAYEILTPDQCVELLKEYQLSKRQVKIMFNTDPVSRYLFLKKGRIVRIIRNSEASGNAIDYRIVVHKG
jgi:DNA-directed RNA polymerase subunit H (RpoH/RPB5)